MTGLAEEDYYLGMEIEFLDIRLLERGDGRRCAAEMQD